MKTKKRGPSRRYNWEALKLEFLQGPWETVESFRRDRGIPVHKKSHFITQKMSGWAPEKKALVVLATQKAAGELVSVKTQQIKEAMERQVKFSQMMQIKGIKGLKKLEPKGVDEARKLLLTGMQEERTALGVSEKGGAKSLTQVNVNLPKTRFDELLDGKDTEGILKLIAEVRAERARRIGKNIIVESETET